MEKTALLSECKQCSTDESVIYTRIAKLKSFLAATDHLIIEYVEGELTEDEFASVKEQRKAWRTEIVQLRASIQDDGKDD